MKTLWACAFATLLAATAQAGSFVPIAGEPPDRVLHAPGYRGQGGPLPITVCLDPTALPATGDALIAVRNAAARFNQRSPLLGNVEVVSEAAIDFESMALHELGHCLGLGHSAVGPQERNRFGGSVATLLYGNALPGGNGVLQAFAGADGVRGSRDDLRGDDRNLIWFERGRNDPFASEPQVVDRHSFSRDPEALPSGHSAAEIASAFAPCVAEGAEASETNSSALRLRPRTQNVMYPVLCNRHRIRQLAPSDVTQLRLAGAGLDGLQDSADDYRVQLRVVGGGDCDIPLRFVSGRGFALCELDVGSIAGSADLVVVAAAALFDRAVQWRFNTIDTAADGEPAEIALNLPTALPEAPPGSEFVVELSLDNHGPGAASDLLLEVQASPPLRFDGQGACSQSPCALEALPAKGRRPLALRLRIDPTAQPGQHLALALRATARSYDANGANNRLTAEGRVGNDPTWIFGDGFEVPATR